MKKIYAKLIAVILQLTLAISVVAMSSYAWMVLASSPAAEGIQITIGGGNTILVAADLTKEVDGVTYHYPDAFQGTLNFTQHKSYDYLDDLSGLTPVSTADGLNWFIPEYYNLNDQEVQDGDVLSGTMKAIQEFTLDDLLKYANLSSDEAELAADGSYVYLDFWVVSPGEDYTLRVSTGEDSGGSFAVNLMQGVETDGGYTLAADGSDASACVRVGLLVNPDEITDNTMMYYQSSPAYSEQYTRLRGAYIDPDGGSYVYSSGYRFTIYEPNGDRHLSSVSAEDGTYVITKPIGLADGAVTCVDIRDRLTVQTGSSWTMAENGTDTQIEQQFQTALLGPSFDGLTLSEISRRFYNEYLGGQVDPYVTKGWFVKSTDTLYTLAENNENGHAAADYLSGVHVAGATDDVSIIKLEKNVPQRIRLFIWLEGTDVDCVNSASASSFAFRIELAGSNVEE